MKVFEKYCKNIDFILRTLILFSLLFIILHLTNLLDLTPIISFRSFTIITVYFLFGTFLLNYKKWNNSLQEKIDKIFSYTLIFLSLLLFFRILGINFLSQGSTIIQLAEYDFYLLHFFLIVTSFFFIAKQKGERQEKKNVLRMKNWWHIIIFILIISLGIFLRVRGIFLKSPWFDEGISMLVAQRIAEGHGPTLLSGFVYTRAPFYHQYLSLFYRAFGELYGYGVLANIPFFIITSIVVYLFTKDLSNKLVALFATFLFSFSWYPIAEFRNIRFYEVFLSLFMLSVYFFYKVLKKYFDSEISDTFLPLKSFSKEVLLFFKKNYLPITLALIFFYLGFKYQMLAAFLIPSFAITTLLIFILTKKKGFLLLFLIFTSGWIIANINRYGCNFQLRTILYQPEITWLESLGRRGFWDTFNFFIRNDYWYFLPILISSIPILIFSKKRFGTIYLTGVVIGYYTLVALQGTGTTAVRYYYPILPLIIILTVVNLFLLFNDLSKKTKKLNFFLIMFILISGIFLTTISSGIRESISIYGKKSRIGTNNRNYREFFDEIERKDLKTESYLIISDRHTSLMYYIHTNNIPQNIIDRMNPRFLKDDIYLGIKELGYRDFEDLIIREQEKTVLFMYDSAWRQRPGIRSIIKRRPTIIFEHREMILLKYE